MSMVLHMELVWGACKCGTLYIHSQLIHSSVISDILVFVDLKHLVTA